MEQLRERVINLEKKDEKYDNIFTKIKEAIARIETKLEQPHPCKWDNVVPVLVEFKNNTDPIRANIFKRLDSHEQNIDILKEDMALSKQNNKLLKGLLEKMEKDEDTKNKDKNNYRNQLKSTLIGALTAFVFILIVEIIKYFTPL